MNMNVYFKFLYFLYVYTLFIYNNLFFFILYSFIFIFLVRSAALFTEIISRASNRQGLL